MRRSVRSRDSRHRLGSSVKQADRSLAVCRLAMREQAMTSRERDLVGIPVKEKSRQDRSKPKLTRGQKF
jgi:hypothetical protein